MGKRCFNFLPQAKQIAKQLILHRLWNGLTQEKIASTLGVTFQQYQKLEKCENRLYAEQLIAICNKYNWDPAIIMMADPVGTLNEWEENKPRHQRAGIDSAVTRIHKKFYAIDINAEHNYFNERK